MVQHIVVLVCLSQKLTLLIVTYTYIYAAFNEIYIKFVCFPLSLWCHEFNRIYPIRDSNSKVYFQSARKNLEKASEQLMVRCNPIQQWIV